MDLNGLSLDQSPPLSVPGPYFAIAPWFAVAAGLLLVFVPEALTSRWLPSTLALTHLLTLGFLGLVMTGAFQQLLPVLAGSPVPAARAVGLVVCAAIGVGTAALAGGFFYSAAPLLWLGLSALALGFGVFIIAAAWALSGARSGHATVKAMTAALAGLTIAAGLGLHLAVGHGGSGAIARHLTDTHAAWGLAGWVGLLVAGVAYQVVPMFQVTPDYPKLVTRGLAPALFATLVAWSGSRVVAPGAALWLSYLPAVALAVFAVATLWVQQRRRRRLPDVTLDYWRLGMVSLLAAIALWAVRPWWSIPELLPGVVFVVGFAMSVVSGMLYKIVPFLVWLHLNNRLFVNAGLRGRVPNMKQVIGERRTRWQFRLHLAAVLALVLAAATGDSVLGRAAGAVLAISSGMLGVNVVGALLLYRRLVRGL